MSRTGRFKRPLVGYLIAVAAVTLALFFRELLTALTGPSFPEYVLFYPTVMAVALLLGIWPALVSIAASVGLLLLTNAIAWLRPVVPADSSSYVGLVLFVGVCLFLSAVAEAYGRSRTKAEAYDREQALRESQKAISRQAELLKLSFDAIIIWRIGGEIESWNNGAEDLYGFVEREALGHAIHELLGSRHDTRWGEVERILRETGHWQGETLNRSRDGREIVVSSRLQVGSDPDGQLRVLEIDRDVTEQKRVQEQLRRAHDELEEKVRLRTGDLQKANRMLLMMSACDQALVQISEEKELISVISQIIQDEGGYPLVWVGLRNQTPGGGLECVAAAGDRAGFLDPADAPELLPMGGPPDRALGTGQAVLVDDISEKSGETSWGRRALEKGFFGIAAIPVVSARKGVIGVMVVYSSDASGFQENRFTFLKEIVDDLAFGVMALRARAERDMAQRDLEQKAAQLRLLTGEIVRAEQRERQRIARLLHDQFQQLLAAALYGIAALSPGMHPGEFAEGTDKLNKLLRECIALSRSLSSELGHPALADPDLRSGLEWLAAWMKEKHGLRVSLTAGEALLISAEETRAMLLQATRELLFNVVKHSGVNTAHVGVERSPAGRIAITVSDEGVGFDTRRLFAYGDTTGGVGLFSIRERLALAGGGIDIESAPGTGSRISVWISVDPDGVGGGPAPVADGHPAAEAGDQEARLPPGSPAGFRRRILIVDDHALVREGLTLQIRQQADLEIVGEAADGESAVELALGLRPDVVTMDLSLPGIDGIEATRRIHAALPDVRIIGLSMFEEPRQMAAMREAGAAAYVSKTASVETLLKSIRESTAASK